MPEYLFEDVASGRKHRLVYPMRDVPSCGAQVTVDGVTYRRLPEVGVQVDTGGMRWNYPYVSQSLPRNLEGCKTNAQGKPIIESRAHEANVAAMHGYERDY